MQPEPRYYTPEEYLALDAAAPEGVRLEYFDGVVYHKGQVYDPSNPDLARAMAGGTPRHGRICGNAMRLVGSQRPDCHVVPSDQQVRLPGGSYVYPDVVLSCDPEFKGQQLMTPQLLVEVLSKSTMHDDMGRKLAAYLEVESLREYWIVDQEDVRVIRYYRTDAGWITRVYSDLDAVVESNVLSLEVPLGELYRGAF